MSLGSHLTCCYVHVHSHLGTVSFLSLSAVVDRVASQITSSEFCATHNLQVKSDHHEETLKQE
jgi:hypothetical protein